ncbi:Ran-specific GTPase-activating protein 30 [Coemansia sp. BCRC 34301]|nr:Ran-specific GTPase-activating protein 30 [Coemansia sp. BCRC 34301]
MDELFSSLALQTVQLVGKAAFGAAGTLALKRVTSYVGQTQHAAEPQAKLTRLLSRFEARLRIVTPAIDLVEIIAARGHSTLAGALHLTHALRHDILALGSSLAAKPSAGVVAELEAVLEKIDDAVPLLSLALTTSGAHLGQTLPTGVSPARLLQASALLARSPAGFPVGRPFALRLYSMFAASVRPKSRLDFTWKEEFGKCRVCLWRCEPDTPDLLSYELRILEDTNDGRHHGDGVSPPEWAADVVRLSEEDGASVGAGGNSIVVPLDRVASLYYTSAGSLLNIEDSTRPVLVLSVNPPESSTAANPLQNMADFGRIDSAVRWYALEISEEEENEIDDSDSEEEGEEESEADLSEEDVQLAQQFDEQCTVSPTEQPPKELSDEDDSSSSSGYESVDESPADDNLLRPLDFLVNEWNLCTLSLLEYMIRLASVEMTEQMSHLEVPDEKLRLYLQSSDNTPPKPNSATTAEPLSPATPRSRRTPVSLLGTPL